MSTIDGRFELATAIAQTSNRVTVKGTPLSFETTPPDLFKLRLNDKRVGITGKKVAAFKRRLARLLPDVKSWIDQIPDDSRLRIEDLGYYLLINLIPLVETVHGPFESLLPPAKKKAGMSPRAPLRSRKPPKKQSRSRGAAVPVTQLERLRYSSKPPKFGKKPSREFSVSLRGTAFPAGKARKAAKGSSAGRRPATKTRGSKPRKTRSGSGLSLTFGAPPTRRRERSVSRQMRRGKRTGTGSTTGSAGKRGESMTRQIRDQLTGRIESGGSYLPSERELANSLKRARNVVRGSYVNLMKAGRIQSEGRKGRTVRASGSKKKAGSSKSSNAPRKAVVSTGFARLATPSKPTKSSQPLGVSENYYFWLQVGAPVRDSIDTEHEALPTEQLPETPRLKVALFDFDDGIRVFPGRDVGEIELQSDNTAIVVRQPFDNPTLRSEESIYQKRLCFPVRTSDRSSDSRLRCNIYYEQILVQSRLIQVRIRQRPRTTKGALSATVDYTLARKLTPTNIALMAPHRLSIMLNDNGNGTHGFRFFGAEEFKSDASFDGQELQDWINQARETMRMAAWGEKTPWQKGRNYLYGGLPDLKRLTTDLIRFAKVGYTFYDSIIDRLSGGVDQSDSLAGLMRSPGLIQIALKQSARNVLPAALIYDYPLETNLPMKGYRLCEAFLADFANSSGTLEAGACFKGDCPAKDARDVICPSGFWGYRHSLGLPLSVKGDSEAPAALTWKNKPELTIGVSTDEAFVMRVKHEEALKAIRRLTWNYAATRAELLKLLKEKSPQLVYFYCHGGIEGTLPFIQVGPSNEIGITRDNLRRERIRWKSPRPLVFINGCHTAALEPSVAIEFISAFVEVAGACGVIGTEITIFEPLAKAFAEECLRRFINGDQIGNAVRGARLKLLKDGNPLGLVYIPYVIAGLHMVQQD